MGRDEFIAKFRREMCAIYGYDENLRFVGTAKTSPSATGGKPTLEPRDFLNFAVEDAITLEKQRSH
jgi:hypothetical protein